MKTGRINFELPLIGDGLVSILNLDADSAPELLATLKIDNILTLLVLNAYTGKLKSLYLLNSREGIETKNHEDKLSNLFKKKIKENLSENDNVMFLLKMIALCHTIDSITLLEGVFNLPLPENFKEIMKLVLYQRISPRIRNGVLVDLDSDGYWELLRMENAYFEPKKGVPDPEKGYYSAYDLPFPVLKGYATGNTHTAFMKNLFKSQKASN